MIWLESPVTLLLTFKEGFDMNEILNAVSVVGFPIVMCGVLCYYIFKTQTALITAINNNSLEIAKLVERMEEKNNE